MKRVITYFCLFIIYVCLFLTGTSVYSQSCDPNTPTFTFDLTGNPDSVWISPSVVRDGLCCGLDPTAKPPIRCVEFYFTLDPGAEGIRFDIASGAIPPGALGYQINCGPVTPVGEMICLNGPGPHRLTFCKPGNNPNTYSITSIAKPKVSNPTVVSDACRGILTAYGYDISSIQWASVPANPLYDSYLSCTAACSTTVITYQAGAPPFIDYQVSGYPLGGCKQQLVVNQTRVYFVNDKSATIQPQNPVICYGGTNASITAYGNGGAPPYKYRWSTGATTQSITVGIGTYWVEVSDSTSCPTAYDTVTVTAFLSPITANAGPDVTSCVNNPNVNLNGSVYQATGGVWSGGTGVYAASPANLSVTYTPTAAEISARKVTHILTTTGNSGCPPSMDTVVQTIVPAPIVNAGPDKTVCANNSGVGLSGTVQFATGGTWSGGSGTFSDPNQLNTLYQPSAAEISAGTVTLTLTSTGNGTCLPVSDQMVITITPAPTVNAGPDMTVCANNAVAQLSGSVTVASGGTWSGGTGSFSNRNVLNPQYTPSSSEISAGSVVLTLTSTGNGSCLPVSDAIIINITPAPLADAGPDQTVCANNVSVSLAGSVQVAAGGTWQGGSGTFNPDRSTLNAVYIPSASEISSGIVSLKLLTTGNGNCIAVSDLMNIRITPAPTINAGPDRTVCANNAAVALAGSVTVATGGVWSGGAGAFTPASSSLNATYTPTAAEIAAGSLTLTLTSTGNGSCLPVSDPMVLTITPAPVVNAGPDITICANNAVAALNGSVTVASGGVWSGGAGSYSPNANTLIASYRPTAAESGSGALLLTLTSTGNGNCLPVSDQVAITVLPAPVTDAGPDQTICANNATATLNGSVSNAGGGQWSGGNGIFTPNANTASVTYAPSAGEITNGFVFLVLTSTGNGNCIPVSDKVLVTITPAPTVSAGPDQTVCGNTPSVSLNGTVTVAGGGQWTSSGTGSFTPGNTSLQTGYAPSPADIGIGSVVLTLNTTGNGNCIPVSDQLTVSLTDIPVADAGPDQTVCTNNFPVQLNASGNPGTWSGGAGTFIPGPAAMNASYTPSAGEVAAGTVTLTYTTIASGACPPVSDNVTITIPAGPVANAGGNRTVCADTSAVPLAGLVQNASGGVWSASGTGTFSPNSASLNAAYIPSATDTANGSVTLSLTTTGNIACNPPAVDKVLLTITPAPTVNAGPDITICADTSSIALQGYVSVASGGTWLTSGSGTFTPGPGTLAASYIPSASDTAARSVTLTLTTTGNGMCKPVSDTRLVTIRPKPIVDAGLSQTICADDPSATLSGNVYNAAGGAWASSGTGVFSPDRFTLNAIYYPSAQDRASGVVNIFLTSTGNGNCKAVSQNSLILSITPAPVADAGRDTLVCADVDGVVLSGKVLIASGGRWSTTGSGIFVPNDSTLNATYRPSAADKTAGNVTLTLTTTGSNNCKSISDNMILSITPAPAADAGADQTVCGNNALVVLDGKVTVASGGVWSGGTGTFNPGANNLNTQYLPSPAEIIAGNAKLLLTTTGNGTCKPVQDIVSISITPAPVANAGDDQTICMDAASVPLQGSVAVAGGGIWSSSGTGFFNPGPDLLTTAYMPTASDKADSTIALILVTSNNGNCLPVSDTAYIYFAPLPTAEAGPASMCASDPSVALNGQVTVAKVYGWTSSGTGSFTPSAQDLNASYVPSGSDRVAGTVVLKLSATTCKTISDSIVLNLRPAPEAFAGADKTVCANNNAEVTVAGTVQNASGGTWSTLGSGQFSSGGLTPKYTPSSADILTGKVDLVLTTTGNGSCKPGTDTLAVTITPAPTVNAGSDQMICADSAFVLLSSSETIASGVVWSSSGTGTFSDTASASARYMPSAGDRSSGSVLLKVKTTGNGTCMPVVDEMLLSITPVPTVNAGADITACEDVDAVAFHGIVSVSAGGSWNTSGTGSFTDPGALQTIYLLTAADKQGGKVLLTLTTTGNGSCKAVTDSVNLFLTSLPASSAGTDRTVCNNNTGITLNGSVSGAPGGTWSSSGSGTFTPSATALAAKYVPSASDTAAGKVTLALTTNVIGGCSVYDTMHLFFIDPYLNLAGHYCFGPNLIIDSDPRDTVSGGSFAWQRNDSLLAGEAGTRLNVQARGVYKVVYTFDACVVTDSSDITLPYPVQATDKRICEGGSTRISATSIPKASYQWMHKGAATGGNSNFIDITDDGIAAYVVFVKDSLNCIARDTAYVQTIPPPVLTLTNVPSCVGETVTLDANPVNNTDPSGSTYKWYRNNVLLADTVSSIKVTGGGNYKAVYQLGECLAADSSVVTFYSLPVSTMAASTFFCAETDKSVSLNAGAGTKFLWLASGDTIREEVVFKEGIYSVKIFNQYNCSVNDSIYVRDVCPPKVYVPTVFSPNGDGKNEYFDVAGEHFKSFRMTIFNRWGEIIFYSEDPNISWDGKYREVEMPVGVYPWTVTYEGSFTEYKGPYSKEGSVTLTR